MIDLCEMLHKENLVHTNLCPQEIFLKNQDIDKMCFLNLYHASWNTKEVLKMDLDEITETTTKIDIRTRNAEYLSPEQLKIGDALRQIADRNFGHISPKDPEVENLMAQSGKKITK